MPIAAIGIGLGTALAGGAAAGATVYGAHKSASATNRASRIQDKSTAEALAVERENEARRRQEYDRSEAEARRQWDFEQQRRAPFRQAADAVLRARAQRLGFTLPPMAEPAPYQASSQNQLGDLVRRPSTPVRRVRPTLGALARQGY